MDKLLCVYCNAKAEYETPEMCHVVKVLYKSDEQYYRNYNFKC